MKNAKPENPIGIFDSGIGGLTIASAIHELMPNESLVYFGDTAHLPYGDKSAEAIQFYATKISDVLLKKRCKVIVIACHSASAVASEIVKKHVGSHAHVLNVIDPTVRFIAEHDKDHKIGLIGTHRTIRSNVYRQKIDALNLDIDFVAHATPLLAAAIEEKANHPDIIDNLLKDYLLNPELRKIQSLILGCTHYPVIKNKISQFFDSSVNVIDTSKLVAQDLQKLLVQYQLLNIGSSAVKAKKHFYISDYTDSFEAATKLFFNEAVKLEHYPLWQ